MAKNWVISDSQFCNWWFDPVSKIFISKVDNLVGNLLSSWQLQTVSGSREAQCDRPITHSCASVYRKPQLYRLCIQDFDDFLKVEKILKGSLDLIPSPSVKIQIMGGKVSLRCKVKTLLGVVNKLLNTKGLLTSPSNVLPYSLK